MADTAVEGRRTPKVIFVNRYYSPDHSATAQLLTDLAEHLAMNGDVPVSVLTSRQCYEDPHRKLPPRELRAGVDVHRVWTSRFGRRNLLGRAIDYLSFYLSSFVYLLTLVKAGDVLVTKTDPPMISVIGALVAKIKGARLVNWLQDLFPEVARELGVKVARSPLYDLLKSLRNWSLQVACRNVVLGDIMAGRVDTEVGHPQKTLVIPNWIINKTLRPVDDNRNELRREWQLTGKFVVAYSGNLGRAHDYATVYQVAQSLRQYQDIVFLFIGGGAGYEALKNIVEREGLDNIRFYPYQSTDKLNHSLAVADVHLVSLVPELEGLIVPSKAYGILAVGKPILFVGSAQGEIATLLDSHHCGISVPPGDADAMTNAILRLVRNTQERETMSHNARALYEREFYYGKSITTWERDVLGSLLSEEAFQQ